jgi:PBSX family phage portal protein
VSNLGQTVVVPKDVSNKIGVRVIKEDKTATRPKSKQLADPFDEMYITEGGGNWVLEPPYNPIILAQLPEVSNVLTPLIDSYVTNITGFGYSFRYLIDMESEEIQDDIKNRAKQEWLALEFFYNNCNFDKTFTKITKLMVQDRETIGWGAIEVIPRGNGKPGSLEYIPAHSIRLTQMHPDPQRIPVIAIDVGGRQVNVIHMKRFRKFCQIRGGQTVWFKEFGDPRKLHCDTGDFEAPGKPVPYDKEATSIMYFPIEVSHSAYGVPRWIGNLLSIRGSRKSEELNYYYFTKGKHVPMAILVKNGSLTESSVSQLQDYSNQLEGVENAHGFLVLEADAGTREEDDVFEGEGKGIVDIKLQPLTQVIQHDALFQDYDKNNRDKVRASMKLPPIYTGESRDYTRATADTARAIAEEQIFNPERLELAHKFNQLLNNHLGIRYINMYFKGPDLSNKKELSQALLPYIKAGALTPNMLVGAVSELLGIDFEQIEEDWGNKPLALTVAELNKSVTIKPAKPGTKKPTVVDSTAEKEVTV